MASSYRRQCCTTPDMAHSGEQSDGVGDSYRTKLLNEAIGF